MLLQGLVHAAAALLVLAGGQKVLDPVPLVRATRSVGFRVPKPAVRTVALGEVGVGVAALVDGSRWTAVAVAASYTVFTAFVLLARRRGGVLASCGCFGKADVPATPTHALVTAAAAAASLTGAPGALPLTAAALVGTAAIAATAYAVLAVLPTVRTA